MAMNGPGPIRKAIQTAKLNKQLRKEEKVRAADRGYNYNRNIVHPNENGSPTMLKGSVKAAIASGMAEKKKDVKAMASNVKGKVTEMKKASEARKAAKANETRGWSNRGDLSGKGSKDRAEVIKINKKTGLYEQTGNKVQDKYKSNKKGVVAKAIDKMQRNKAISKGGVPKPKGKKGFIGN